MQVLNLKTAKIYAQLSLQICSQTATVCVTGKSDPYCEITMGAQEHKTKVIPNTLNPKWNASMQFTIRDLHEDVLCITVYDRDLFTPNGRYTMGNFTF